MTKRARTCPTTGVPLKGVDEAFQSDDGRELDAAQLRERLSDCNLFGLRMIGRTIYGEWVPWAEAARQFKKHRLGFETGTTPTSYYHLHQLRLGENGAGPILYCTHADSLTAGSNSYGAADIAKRTRNRSGLKYSASTSIART